MSPTDLVRPGDPSTVAIQASCGAIALGSDDTRGRRPSRVDFMTGGSRRRRTDGVLTDLVQYLMIVVPELASLAVVAPVLADLVDGATIHILDLIVVSRDGDGAVTILEAEEVESLARLAQVDGEIGGLLSDHDLELVSLALRPSTVGMVVVAEDRWAEALSVAARQAGGLIVAGERIPAPRVEAAIAELARSDQRGT